MITTIEGDSQQAVLGFPSYPLSYPLESIFSLSQRDMFKSIPSHCEPEELSELRIMQIMHPIA